MVRSLMDLADTPHGLVHILQGFEDKGVEVASVEEPWFDYKSNFHIVYSIVGIVAEQAEKKRRLGMERAKDAGRMGRKPDQGKLGQVQKLRQAGLTVREITELCGISRSTYYRHMGKQKK
jgi:DNA invertase Pin-like site-specific DNA recombinase